MLRERVSSYGCTREVGELERSKEATIYSFLSALQTSQVHHTAAKNAFLLINCKISRNVRHRKTNASVGWLQTRHNSLVWEKTLF